MVVTQKPLAGLADQGERDPREHSHGRSVPLCTGPTYSHLSKLHFGPCKFFNWISGSPFCKCQNLIRYAQVCSGVPVPSCPPLALPYLALSSLVPVPTIRVPILSLSLASSSSLSHSRCGENLMPVLSAPHSPTSSH